MSADFLNAIIRSPEQRQRLEKRFWAKVEIRGADECWPWIAKAQHSYGYGMLALAVGRVDYAHRIAFALANDGIPDGAHIRHRCDNTWCNNPKHLLDGTQADNVQDMMERGRHVKRVDTAETRAKIAAARKANPPRLSPEGKAKKVAALKRRWEDPEWRARFSQMMSGKGNPMFGRGAPRSPEITAKIVAAKKASGYRHSEATREKMRQAAAARKVRKREN